MGIRHAEAIRREALQVATDAHKKIDQYDATVLRQRSAAAHDLQKALRVEELNRSNNKVIDGLSRQLAQAKFKTKRAMEEAKAAKAAEKAKLDKAHAKIQKMQAKFKSVLQAEKAIQKKEEKMKREMANNADAMAAKKAHEKMKAMEKGKIIAAQHKATLLNA